VALSLAVKLRFLLLLLAVDILGPPSPVGSPPARRERGRLWSLAAALEGEGGFAGMARAEPEIEREGTGEARSGGEDVAEDEDDAWVSTK
jgi:hypothetical protein